MASVASHLDRRWFNECLRYAEAALDAGAPPIVAIAIQGNGEIGRAISGEPCSIDPRCAPEWAHAELAALMNASSSNSSGHEPIMLVASLEPCLMCLGAAANFGVSEISFAYPASADGYGWLPAQLDIVDVPPRLIARPPSVFGPYAENEMQCLFAKFVERYPEHPSVGYVKGILKSPGPTPAEVEGLASVVGFNEFYEGGRDWAFGNVPTRLVVSLEELLAPGSRVLEIGAGDGRDAVYLARRGHHVYASDVSSAAIDKLSKRGLPDGVGRISANVGDAVSVLRAPPDCDAIVGITVLDHLFEDRLAEACGLIASAVRPGALVAFQVHTREDPGFIDHINGSETAAWVKHYFRRGELLRRFVSGFDVIDYREWIEADFDHGDPHEHGFASIIAKRR